MMLLPLTRGLVFQRSLRPGKIPRISPQRCQLEYTCKNGMYITISSISFKIVSSVIKSSKAELFLEVKIFLNELASCYSISDPMISHTKASELSKHTWTMWMSWAVELSVSIGVPSVGCGCPNSINVLMIGTAS